MRFALLLVLGACATAKPPLPLEPANEPPAVEAGARAAEPRCDRWLALEGRANVAGNWGPGGSFIGCHVGPGPQDELRAQTGDASLRRCLAQAGVARLEASVHVAGDGRVNAVELLELEPPTAPVRHCLRRIERARFQALGCGWGGELSFAALGEE